MHGPHVQTVSNAERTYYIVPPGMNVIFRDEYGNELKRQAQHTPHPRRSRTNTHHRLLI
jgi:hypothetical protein